MFRKSGGTKGQAQSQRQSLKTGEDAISFFAKHGNNTQTKIINCNRARYPPEVFRPYDLEVIMDEKQLNEEHFTISNRGVVHIFKKNAKRMSEDEIIQTEFIFTSDWMHEATLFNVLTSMRLFKNYLIGKVFSQWKSDVRYKRFVKTRQKLAQSLKYVIPAFQPSFVQVNNILYEMQKTKCFQELKPNKQYDLEAFGAEQKKERENSKDFYDKKIETITKLLEDLIKEVTESKNIRIDEEFENHKLGQKVKHKAMTVQKFEEQTIKNVLKLRRNNIASLGIFIRLVDYMAVEAQVKINQDAADLVYSEMATEDRKAGITCFVQFDEEGMAFVPPEGEFVQAFATILTGVQTVCSDIARVITHPQFNQYTQGLSSETALRFKDIVEGSESYRLIKSKITNKLVEDFAHFRQETAGFEACRVVNQFDSEFNFQEFKKAGHDLRGIQEQLDQLRKWESSVSSSIRAQINRGLVFVNGKRLREKLSNAVRGALGSIRDYLIDLAETKSQEILDGLRVTRRSLGKSMSNLGEYVDYVKSLNDSKVRLERLADEKGVFEEMSSILRKSAKSKDITGAGAPTQKESTLQTKYETIIAELENCRNDIAAKEALVAGGQQEMLLVLDKNIAEVKEKITELTSKINVGSLIQASTPSAESCSDLERLKKRFEESKKRAETYISSQQILGQPVSEIEEIDDFEKQWEVRFRLWKSRDDWDQDRAVWYETPFPGQDALEIEKRIKEYEKEVTWIKQSLPRDSKDEVYEKLNEDVRGVSSVKDLILDLGNRALQERHMIKIFALLSEGNTYSPSRSFTLSELINAGILEVKDKVGEIASTASGEYAISQTLEGIKKVWATMEFIVINYRDIKDKFILGTIEEIMMRLEDDQVSIQTMLGSKNVHEIRAGVEEWEQKLSYISDVIDEWLMCQRQWMYLENIFSAEDIIKQLPNESKQFKKVDTFWKDVMAKTHRNPSILDTCASEGLLRRLQSNNRTLEEIQKCLEDYLETKRAAFPRFYFLSNDELLQILSQTRNPQAVQPHLRKCFDNMASVEFSSERNSKSIIAMTSADGEKVSFSAPVLAEGAVEFWLSDIERMMVKSLYDKNKACLQCYPPNALERRAWFFGHPAQLVLAIDQVLWTKGCTDAIELIEKGSNKKALDEWFDFSVAQIGKMVEIVRGELTEHERTLMGALIVLDVHAREVVK